MVIVHRFSTAYPGWGHMGKNMYATNTFTRANFYIAAFYTGFGPFTSD